jgi:hypothetical protein
LVSSYEESSFICFDWLRKHKVKNCIYNAKKESPLEAAKARGILGNGEALVLPSSVMAIREFLKPEIFPVKSEEYCTFVDYTDGCGKFVMADWLNRPAAPFARAMKNFASDINANEMKVLKLWEQASLVYSSA